MALPTEVIEALTQGKPLPKKKLDQAWVNPILDLVQTGIVCPTKALWGWEVKRGGGRTLAHEAAKRGPLPKDFDAWGLADQDGWTVAHEAAGWGHLPKDFDQWDWADQAGRTVAYVAAFHGHLPQGFDQWALTDPYGQTIAHVVAQRGHLPKDFSQWSLADPYGRTVAEVVVNRLKDRAKESFPPKDHLDFWFAPTSKGSPVMDFALGKGLISSETYEAIQQAILKAQQAQDQARMKTLSSMVF